MIFLREVKASPNFTKDIFSKVEGEGSENFTLAARIRAGFSGGGAEGEEVNIFGVLEILGASFKDNFFSRRIASVFPASAAFFSRAFPSSTSFGFCLLII